MTHRSPTPPWLRTLATAFVGIWALCLACNPSFISTVGGNPVNTADTPDGYVMFLLMNKTTSSILVEVDVTKRNGTTERHNFQVGPLFFYTFANDCDLAAVQIVNFGFSSPGGVVTQPSNLGQLVAGQGIDCGKVMAVSADGNPPTFSVQVY